MPYIVMTYNKPNIDPKRLEIRPQHLEYLRAHKDALLAAGARTTDDGEGTLGGFFILETEDRGVAEKFIHNEPIYKAGLFQDVIIVRWRKALFDHKPILF